MSIDETLTSARTFITRYLSGEVNENSHPEIFDDDILMFAVGTLDEGDPEWILRQLADQRWPVERRVEIFGPMRIHYAEGYKILQAEAPDRLYGFRDPETSD